MSAQPFNIVIGNNPSTNGSFIDTGGVVTWVPTPGLNSTIDILALQNILRQNAKVNINTGGDITLVNNLMINNSSSLSLGANNILLEAILYGSNLNLTLHAIGTVSSGVQGALVVKGLTLNVGQGCYLGAPYCEHPISTVNGLTDGSNIVLENTKFGQGTHFFNGTDISFYISAQKAANTTVSGTKASTASTASTATTSTASTATTSTSAEAKSSAPPMTEAYKTKTATAQNPNLKSGTAATAGNKTDAAAKPDPNDETGAAHKAKK